METIISVATRYPETTVIDGMCYIRVIFLNNVSEIIYIIWIFSVYYVIIILIFVFFGVYCLPFVVRQE